MYCHWLDYLRFPASACYGSVNATHVVPVGKEPKVRAVKIDAVRDGHRQGALHAQAADGFSLWQLMNSRPFAICAEISDAPSSVLTHLTFKVIANIP